MVMATTRSLLRAAAQPEHTPGEVLKRVNDLLVPDIPENMFVTCLYGILELSSGLLKFANAGQNLPLQRSIAGVHELRARGMPLGLMEGMDYEEKEVTLPPQSCLILYSDGLVEAHNRKNEMFGTPRLQCAIAENKDVDTGLIDCMLETLSDFTGRDWEQEDDMTVITLRRDALPVPIQVVTEKAVAPIL
jgi:serine phosphatase RsbU (regulator of sigma subunit)